MNELYLIKYDLLDNKFTTQKTDFRMEKKEVILEDKNTYYVYTYYMSKENLYKKRILNKIIKKAKFLEDHSEKMIKQAKEYKKEAHRTIKNTNKQIEI